MGSLAENLIVSTLSWYFRRVAFPASMAAALSREPAPLVVVPNDAWVWQGLLGALAKAFGFARPERVTPSTLRDLSSVGNRPLSAETSPNAADAHLSRSTAPANPLRWISLQDSAVFEALFSHSPHAQLATLNVFQLRGPVKELPQHNPGIGWNIGMLLTRRVMTVLLGEPIPLSDALRHGTGQRAVFRMRRLLKLDFNRNLRLVRGIPVRPLDEQARAVLSGADFERELRVLSERAGETLPTMHRRASHSFYELAANQRRSMYSVLAVVARVLLSRLFTSIEVRGLAQLKEAMRTHAVVIVPMHRSHLDYILLQYKLYEAAINPPLVAAGINLSFWPVGALTRSVGAYFVKRNARDRIHMLVLRRYVSYLMQRGHSQMFFIEGGRSRSGKMMRPKMGLLSVLFDAYKKGLRKEILFVPTSISYEQVIEDEEFGVENTGRGKTKEDLRSTVSALDILKRKYGEVVVTFGAPQSLSRFMEERRKAIPSTNARTADREALNELGLGLVWGIRKHISPSLTNLAYTALMAAPQYGLTRSDLAESVHQLARVVDILRAECALVGENTPSLQRFLEGRVAILNDLTREGIVERARCLSEDVFFVPGKRRFTADFYRNGVFHLFFPLSVLAVLELLREPLTGTAARPFHGIFQSDLLLPSEDQFVASVEDFAQRLEHHGILSREGDLRRFASRSPGLFLPTLLESSLESILWVWQNLMHPGDVTLDEEAPDVGSSATPPLRILSYPRFMQRLQHDFRAARYAGFVHRTEASSMTALQSVLEVFLARDFISIEEKNGTRSRIILKRDGSAEFAFLMRAHDAIRRWRAPVHEHRSL